MWQSDTIVLEDETGRIAITGALEALKHSLVTGVVMALKGKEVSLGEFEVISILLQTDFHLIHSLCHLQVSEWLFYGGLGIEEIAANKPETEMDIEMSSLQGAKLSPRVV